MKNRILTTIIVAVMLGVMAAGCGKKDNNLGETANAVIEEAIC